MKATATQRLIEEAYTQFQNGSELMELNTWMNLDNHNICPAGLWATFNAGFTPVDIYINEEKTIMNTTANNTTIASSNGLPIESALKKMDLDPEPIMEWLIESGYIYMDIHGNYQPTQAGIAEGFPIIKEPHSNAIQSIVNINDETGTLRFFGNEGSVMFNPYAETNLKDIWINLGSPYGLDPKSWIKEHGMEDHVFGTITDGDPTASVCYLASLVKDGPLVDYVMRMYNAQLCGEPGEPGCYLI